MCSKKNPFTDLFSTSFCYVSFCVVFHANIFLVGLKFIQVSDYMIYFYVETSIDHVSAAALFGLSSF
jgi:hypothetical protein